MVLGLFSLLLEVRENIYCHLLPRYRINRNGPRDTFHSSDQIDHLGINIDVLLVNKQIRAEVEKIRPGGLLSQTNDGTIQPTHPDTPRNAITGQGIVWSIHLKHVEKLVLNADLIHLTALVRFTNPHTLPRLRCVEIVLRQVGRDLQSMSADYEVPALIEGINNRRIFQAGYEYELLSRPVSHDTWQASNFPTTRIRCNMVVNMLRPSYSLYVRTRLRVSYPASKTVRTLVSRRCPASAG